MPVDPPTGYTERRARSPTTWRCRCVESSLRLCAGHLGYEIRLALETGTTPCLSPSVARVVVGRRPMIWAQLAYLRRPNGGRDSAHQWARVAHLVVRLVLEKSAGSLALPVYHAPRNFSKRGGTGITNRRLASKSHGGANRQQRPALFAALPGAAPGCSPIPRSSEDKFNLSGTTHCTLPISLRPAPVQISDGLRLGLRQRKRGGRQGNSN